MNGLQLLIVELVLIKLDALFVLEGSPPKKTIYYPNSLKSLKSGTQQKTRKAHQNPHLMVVKKSGGDVNGDTNGQLKFTIEQEKAVGARSAEQEHLSWKSEHTPN